MHYVLMIHTDEASAAKAPQSELAEVAAGVEAINQEFVAEARKVGRVRMAPSPSSRVVRVKGNQRFVTDGPFVDTKEQLAGFWLVEASSGEEAVELAKRLPLTDYASVEIRPVAGIDVSKIVSAW